MRIRQKGEAVERETERDREREIEGEERGREEEERERKTGDIEKEKEAGADRLGRRGWGEEAGHRANPKGALAMTLPPIRSASYSLAASQ